MLDRIWAEIGRVTGTIIERDGPASLLVDEGPAKGGRIVLIRPEAAGRIQVRFPRLEPGYLINVVGLKHDGYLQALIPATSQPPYRKAIPRRADGERPRARPGQRDRGLARARGRAGEPARARLPGPGPGDELRACRRGAALLPR